MAFAVPKGYEIRITTWENDGDNYKMQIVNGLSREDAEFVVDVLNSFRSDGRHNDEKKVVDLGNERHSEEKLCTIIMDILTRHTGVTESMTERILYYYQHEEMFEFVVELLGTPSEGFDWGFCRVMESFNVYYYPEEIDVDDVTDEFNINNVPDEFK